MFWPEGPRVVVDFLLAYLAQFETPSWCNDARFKCDGRELGECSLSYGQRGNILDQEGWGNQLFYKHDPVTGAAKPDSFVCEGF